MATAYSTGLHESNYIKKNLQSTSSITHNQVYTNSRIGESIAVIDLRRYSYTPWKSFDSLELLSKPNPFSFIKSWNPSKNKLNLRPRWNALEIPSSFNAWILLSFIKNQRMWAHKTHQWNNLLALKFSLSSSWRSRSKWPASSLCIATWNGTFHLPKKTKMVQNNYQKNSFHRHPNVITLKT